MSGLGKERRSSLRSQLKRSKTGRVATQSQSSWAFIAEDVKFNVREVPADVLLMLFPWGFATVLNAYPGTIFFLAPLTVSFFFVGLAQCSGFPWKFNLFCCQPAFFIASFLLALVFFPKQEDGSFFPLNESTSGLFQDYVKQILIVLLTVCFVGVFLSCIPAFYFRRRVPNTIVLVLAAWSSICCFLMGGGLLLFQWFFLSSELSATQELLIVGFLYPVFGASVGRVLFSDGFATLGALLWCETPTGDLYESSQAVHVRMLWIIFNRMILGFAGSLSLINIESNGAFALSFLTSNVVEIVFTYGWFYGSAYVLPKLLKRMQYRETVSDAQVAPTDLTSDQRDSTEKENATEAMTIPSTVGGLIVMWLKLFTDRENLPVRFILTRSYEERAERFVTLGATLVLMVCGSSKMDQMSLLARGVIAYVAEILVVDPLKTCIQHRMLGLFTVQRTHTMYEYFILCAGMGLPIATVFITRLYFHDHQKPLAF